MNDLDIKKIRTDLGLTQVEFAKRLGISMRTVQNWESGGAIPESKHEILRALMPQQYYGGNVEQANVMGDNIKNADDEKTRCRVGHTYHIYISEGEGHREWDCILGD